MLYSERMNLAGIPTATSASGVGRKKSLVAVGVKLDSRSLELLTWTLVKVVQPGDCVIALHVLPNSLAGTSSILSLMKAFDSALAIYDELCSLKQVDLKLKLCRGDSMKRLLVKEVKAYAASMLILGISTSPNPIRSSVYVAEYCAIMLAPACSVVAVDDGKVMFIKKASASRIAQADTSIADNRHKKIAKRGAVTEKFKRQSHDHAGKNRRREVQANGKGVSNSLTAVPFQMQSTGSAEFGLSFIRRMFVPDCPFRRKSKPKKLSMYQGILMLRLSNQYSSTAIFPDQKQNNSAHCKENSATLAICPGLAPISPHHDISYLPKELECLLQKYSSVCRLFSFQELLSATSNFMPENMVGQGGSSWVYRGCLPDGKVVAVKVLKQSENTIKEFISEIEIITEVSHKNIVSLFGFSVDANYLLLVYDYLPRGSLEENLHGDKKKASALSWNGRYKVGLGVAEALTYLHDGSKEPVIHRDVKSSNILLLDDFEPQLSDFALAQRASVSSSEIVCTDVAGTFGYLAPEYFMHGKITEKIDVYAFGVVLLELLSGRKPICGDNMKGLESLVMWAKPKLEDGKLSDLLDSSLRLEIGCNEIERMVLAARFCVRRSPRSRPKMSTILKLLQGDPEVIAWANQLILEPEVHGCMDDDDLVVPSNIQSHLNIALLDLEVGDALSVNSTKRNVTLNAYLECRCNNQSIR